MRRGKQQNLSAEQKTDIWQRWKAGESLHKSGGVFNKDHGSTQFLLSKHEVKSQKTSSSSPLGPDRDCHLARSGSETERWRFHHDELRDAVRRCGRNVLERQPGKLIHH